MVDAKAVKDKISKKAANLRSKVSSFQTAHKHCRMCGITIDIKAEPRICKDDECIAKLERREKNDKTMRIMFFVFAIAFGIPILLSLKGAMG
tara:strand:- start:23 stop:298 length:276 start_codon:yes stop_codon:yes gene_type:complete